MERPIRVLLDAGILSNAEFAAGAVKQHVERWGGRELTVPIYGFMRKPPHNDAAYQRQVDAIFTIGRLIRQGRIQAYKYIEIQYEVARSYRDAPICDALHGCQIETCLPAVERTCFRGGNFLDVLMKGGKKDRKLGVRLSALNQIPCFEWLCSLEEQQIQHIRSLRPQLIKFRGITAFDLESLRNINWFKFLCDRSGSPENYPDIFHLWTAERNTLDVFLTLESVCRTS